jgi:hypothetical protein
VDGSQLGPEYPFPVRHLLPLQGRPVARLSVWAWVANHQLGKPRSLAHLGSQIVSPEGPRFFNFQGFYSVSPQPDTGAYCFRPTTVPLVLARARPSLDVSVTLGTAVCLCLVYPQGVGTRRQFAWTRSSGFGTRQLQSSRAQTRQQKFRQWPTSTGEYCYRLSSPRYCSHRVSSLSSPRYCSHQTSSSSLIQRQRGNTFQQWRRRMISIRVAPSRKCQSTSSQQSRGFQPTGYCQSGTTSQCHWHRRECRQCRRTARMQRQSPRFQGWRPGRDCLGTICNRSSATVNPLHRG